MILVINVCKEKLHYYEFVKPVEDILKKVNISFFTKHYMEISKGDLVNCSKAIICGTSLKDIDCLKDNSLFSWIQEFEKPLLGICAGLQIIWREYSKEKLSKEMYRKKHSRKSPKERLHEHLQIGLVEEEFEKPFFGIAGKREVYYLHRYSVIFEKNFVLYTVSGIHNGQHNCVKHVEREVYGVLFHPEVRNKEMILNFVRDKNE